MNNQNSSCDIEVLEAFSLPAVTSFPTPIAHQAPEMSDEEKVSFISERFREILEVLGLDLSDDSLAKTPERVAKMYVNEIFSGLKLENFPKMTFIENKFKQEGASGLILVKATFHSFCEHHLVPMTGEAFIGYVPNKKVIGLSKIPRLVRYFAKRPQVQERLTAQIADSLALLLETNDVAVSISATHFCVMARGIEDECSHTVTNILRGNFNLDKTLRQEFFEGINRQTR